MSSPTTSDQISCKDIFGNEHIVEKKDAIKRSSAYGIAIHDKQILLVKEMHSGRWDIPGGGVEEGETLEEGLIREFHEETGLEIIVGTQLTHKENYFFEIMSGKVWDAKRYYYYATLNGGALIKNGNGDDVLEAKMFDLTALKNVSFTSATEEIMQEFLEIFIADHV